VLSRNNQNGYQNEHKRWKFFRASEPDELWQIDFRGPFSVQGKKYWFLVYINDYSRFIVAAEQFDHDLTTAETVAVLERAGRFPKAILCDHGSQFKEQWRAWCSRRGIEAHFAHPAYPQDKGKVECAFRISIGSLLLISGNSHNGSMVNYANTSNGLTIHAFTEA
jgi:transposase InsO family protein